VQNLQLFIHSAKDTELQNLNRAETPVSALFTCHTLKATQNNQGTKYIMKIIVQVFFLIYI